MPKPSVFIDHVYETRASFQDDLFIYGGSWNKKIFRQSYVEKTET